MSKVNFLHSHVLEWLKYWRGGREGGLRLHFCSKNPHNYYCIHRIELIEMRPADTQNILCVCVRHIPHEHPPRSNNNSTGNLIFMNLNQVQNIHILILENFFVFLLYTSGPVLPETCGFLYFILVLCRK